MRKLTEKQREATRFVAAIIFERLTDAPAIDESGVLQAEWLFYLWSIELMERREMASLRDLLEQKKVTIGADGLIERIKAEIKIF